MHALIDASGLDGPSAGHSELDSLLVGFRGSVGLVVLTSIIGIVLAIFAYRSVRKVPTPQEGSLVAQITV